MTILDWRHQIIKRLAISLMDRCVLNLGVEDLKVHLTCLSPEIPSQDDCRSWSPTIIGCQKNVCLDRPLSKRLIAPNFFVQYYTSCSHAGRLNPCWSRMLETKYVGDNFEISVTAYHMSDKMFYMLTLSLIVAFTFVRVYSTGIRSVDLIVTFGHETALWSVLQSLSLFCLFD